MIELGRDDYDVFANQVLWSLFGITAVIVALRIFCRIYYGTSQRAGLGLDDYITVFCLILSLVVCVLVTIATGYGLGKHVYELDDDQKMNSLKYNAVINAVQIWQFSLPKFAIIAILKRILNYGTKTAVLFWTLGITSQACIFAVSVWWFKQCTPVDYVWDKSIEGGTCVDVSVMSNLAYFTSSYSAFLDIFFAFYPIPFIMRLNMPLRSRLAVAGALSLSSLAFVVSVIKLTALGEAFAISETDPTYPVPYLDILGMSEGYILIICSSLPTLGPLFRAAKGKLTSRDTTTNKSGAHIGGSSLHSLHKSFGNSKGQRLTDEMERSISGGNSSSIDDIPLVSTSHIFQSSNATNTRIQKTVNISVISEAMEPESQTQTHSAQIF
ncbi:hypothetical protein F4820DRAFT_401032 [Hypoxylon rubiginosum]|uniref:Uncharacterized protein n=1 Tax=Hypoxylon rubiginosum TaxID=110542 RepID=A0ACB9ZH31_9PEZI|nr:hypothetical protein F4820DRAFT_401032 [Hypoxylon rubiginosum]